MTQNTALSLRTPACRLILPRSASSMAPTTGPTDPAINVMTDFASGQVIVTRDTAPIDEALAHMRDSGVRLLFVVDAEQRLLGLITSSDIQGEKPLRYLQSVGCTLTSCTRDDVLVRDIMVPVAGWRVLGFASAKRATMGQIVSAFKAVGRRHLVVVEMSEDGDTDTVRGLFSASVVTAFRRADCHAVNHAERVDSVP